MRVTAGQKAELRIGGGVIWKLLYEVFLYVELCGVKFENQEIGGSSADTKQML